MEKNGKMTRRQEKKKVKITTLQFFLVAPFRVYNGKNVRMLDLFLPSFLSGFFSWKMEQVDYDKGGRTVR